jgi:hypothetical protein
MRLDNGPRRTTYAVAIEARAKAIQEALGICHYDACLERIEHIRRFCDCLEREIRAEREANPQHVERERQVRQETARRRWFTRTVETHRPGGND